MRLRVTRPVIEKAKNTGGGAWEPISVLIPNNTSSYGDFTIPLDQYGQFMLVWDEVGSTGGGNIIAQIQFQGGALYTSNYRDASYYVNTGGASAAYRRSKLISCTFGFAWNVA